MEATIEDDILRIEGYDIGSRVEEYWGDSDYEYTTTVDATEVLKLYALLGVDKTNKRALLQALADRFHTNTCYSEIQQWLDDNKVKYQGFSWA